MPRGLYSSVLLAHMGGPDFEHLARRIHFVRFIGIIITPKRGIDDNLIQLVFSLGQRFFKLSGDIAECSQMNFISRLNQTRRFIRRDQLLFICRLNVSSPVKRLSTPHS